MLIQKYICDRCGKEVEPFKAYSVKIDQVYRPDYMQYQPITMYTKHMCLECAKSIFNIDSQEKHAL